MAKVLYICDKDYDFQPRQIPIDVDHAQMVVEFTDLCIDDTRKPPKDEQKELDHFANKFRTLTKEEVSLALLVPGKDVLKSLPLMVPCIGCRKSVEKLFCQVQKSLPKALSPLIFTPLGELSVQQERLGDTRALFSLFHVHGRWLEVWDALSVYCKEKVLIIDNIQLLGTMDKYLKKHKFCVDCQSMVMLAYNIVIGKQDGSSDKGYRAALFEKLRCCPIKKHIHVLNDEEFIDALLDKADPDFIGGRRELHAKTLDIAQEEILVCLGIHIFHRLNKISQTLRSEEQSWVTLMHIGLDVMHKSYQAALEKKQGASDLELLCEMLEEKEKRQGARQEMKKQKRKLKKEKMATKNVGKIPEETMEVDNPGLCSNVGPDILSTDSNNLDQDNHRLEDKCSDANLDSLTVPLQNSDPGLQDPQDQGTEKQIMPKAALEKKQGASDLELLCEMLEEKEKRQGARQEMKKQKRKLKKEKMATKNVGKIPEETMEVDNPGLRSNVGPDILSTDSNNLDQDNHRLEDKCSDANLDSLTMPLQNSDPRLQDPQDQGTEKQIMHKRSDVGPDIFSTDSKNLDQDNHRLEDKCSDANLDSLTVPLQNSDPSLQDPKDQVTENKKLDTASVDSNQSCSNQSLTKSKCTGPCTNTTKRKYQCHMFIIPAQELGEQQVDSSSSCCNHRITFQLCEYTSLLDLLDELDCSEEESDDPGISEEEIIAFKAQHGDWESMREKLCKNLRRRFQNYMQIQLCNWFSTL